MAFKGIQLFHIVSYRIVGLLKYIKVSSTHAAAEKLSLSIHVHKDDTIFCATLQISDRRTYERRVRPRGTDDN